MIGSFAQKIKEFKQEHKYCYSKVSEQNVRNLKAGLKGNLRIIGAQSLK
jgi:hypothetical protein